MFEYTWTNWAATLAPPTFQDSTKTIDPFFFPFFLFFFVVSSFFFFSSSERCFGEILWRRIWNFRFEIEISEPKMGDWPTTRTRLDSTRARRDQLSSNFKVDGKNRTRGIN